MLWIVELTVGAEEFVDGANARKTSKYAELVSELSERWTVNFKALELGCRGLPTSALSTCVRWLADTGTLASVSRAVQALSGDVSRISLSASLWIWNTRSANWGYASFGVNSFSSFFLPFYLFSLRFFALTILPLLSSPFVGCILSVFLFSYCVHA